MNISPPISAAAGVRYLLRTVSTADQKAIAGTITDYYTIAGTPAGRWLGTGARLVGLTPGQQISPAAAHALFSELRHPVTSELLGPSPAKVAQTHATALAELDGADTGPLGVAVGQAGQFHGERDAQGRKVDRVAARPVKTVSCYDLTFRVPKSVSILFAVAPSHIQQQILAAHHQAIADVIEWGEAHVFQTRSGSAGVMASEIRGVIAGRWDHWDSRDGDPHLHSHVAVSNRVQRAFDGKWLALDGQALYRSAVAMSEMHENLLLDGLHRRLGLTYHVRPRVTLRSTRAVVADVQGVDDELIDHFSSRAVAIRDMMADLEREWRANHDGATPSARQVAKWKDQAWAATRPDKDATHRTLADLCARWGHQIRSWGFDPKQVLADVLHHARDTHNATDLGHDQQVMRELTRLMLAELKQEPGWGLASSGKPRRSKRGTSGRARYTPEALTEIDQTLTAPGGADQVLDHQAGQAVASQVEARATWSVLQVRAAAERLTRLVRFTSPAERERLVDDLTARAIARCVPLHSGRYQVPDGFENQPHVATRGRAGFDVRFTPTYTNQVIWDAEQAMFDALTMLDPAVPHLDAETASRLVAAASETQLATRGFHLAADQARVVTQVLTDQRACTGVVGPAGAGKTTSMRALRSAWETVHGPGSVVGLATSAAASYVLGEELGIGAHTVAKWLSETCGYGKTSRPGKIEQAQTMAASPRADIAARGRTWLTQLLADEATYTIRPGQLYIVDEASMTGTLELNQIRAAVTAQGGRMVLLGDPAQLDAVNAGGILGWAERHGQTFNLESLWRFKEDWMGPASLGLRAGKTTALAAYAEHGMIVDGTTEDMLEAAYQSALDDLKHHRSVVLIAATNEDVTDLAQRASLELRTLGLVDSTVTVDLADGVDAGLGERILAREVDRKVLDDSGVPIFNGTILTVETISPDGAVTGTREDTGAKITLPADYVNTKCQLAYAVTAHRAQGVTVDNSYLAVGSQAHLSRELFYVAMTRGRHVNRAHVGLLTDEEATALHLEAHEIPTLDDRLEQILRTEQAERTAHEVAANHHHEGHSLARLTRERDYLAGVAAMGAFEQWIRQVNPGDADQILASPSVEALAAVWRQTVITHPQQTRSQLAKPLWGDWRDAARCMHSRIVRWVQPDATPVSVKAWADVLAGPIRTEDRAITDLATQNRKLVVERLQGLADGRYGWEVDLGPQPPENAPEADLWASAKLSAAVYRDMWAVDTADALGPKPDPAVNRKQYDQWRAARDLLSRSGWVPQPDEDFMDAWEALDVSEEPVWDEPDLDPLPPLADYAWNGPGL